MKAMIWVYHKEYLKEYLKGVTDTNAFYAWLFNSGRGADAEKAANDNAYFDKLFNEYKNSKSKK